jgi:hypothetical protein
MRKIVLFVAVLLFMAVPAMAVSNVTITCTHGTGGDANLVTVSYASDTNRIRAFGLDIDVNNANDDANNDANITQVIAVDPCYRIYPGQISIVNGDVNEYKTPYALSDINDANVTIEMGSLYTTDANYSTDVNAGYNMIPNKSGTLLRFRIRCGYAAGHGTDCNYVVTENALRGGVVMEDPYEYPNVTLCSGSVHESPSVLDFGDANDSYKTLLVSDGARHLMAGPETGLGPILGVLIDAEADGQPSANCLLDDTTNLDDEDGITNLVAVVNEGGSVTVTVSQAGGYLNGWIDWGKDGSFVQAGDHVVTNVWLGVGAGQVVPIPVPPAGAVRNNPLVSRWRITSYDTPTVDYYGLATNGEVEDYNQPIVKCHVPNVVNMKQADANAALIANGFVIGTITTECNNTIADGNVISTNPPFCTTGQCDVAVNLVVSKGHNVPNVLHMTQANACAAIVNAGFVCNPVDANGGAEPIGQVFYQKPAPGPQPCGSTVDVNVASYCLDPVITPATEYNAWVAWNRPNCWCYKRQCRGDTNGSKSGVLWVSSADFNLFKSAFNKTDTVLKNIPGGICADVDHAKSGVIRVSSSDFNIFKSYFNKSETSVPCCDPDKNCILTTADKYNFWAN